MPSASKSVCNVRRIATLLLFSILIVACGVSGHSTSDEPSGGISSEIVMDSLDTQVGGMSVYEIVQLYKPDWLRKRGRSSLQDPVPIKVYVDNTTSSFGTVSDLRQLDAGNVSTVKRYTAVEAQSEFGIENTSGAILIRTKSGGE